MLVKWNRSTCFTGNRTIPTDLITLSKYICRLALGTDSVFAEVVSVKVQGSRLFVTYTIIQGIISSEMEVRTGPLNGQCKKNKNKR